MFSWFGRVNFAPYSKVHEFAVHLKDGRMMGSRCQKCGRRSFPPRADCADCMSPDFELVEINGKGRLFTYSRIAAAPTGFEDDVPYTIGVVELEEGGRLLAWIGDTIEDDEVAIGMDVQVVPRILEESADIKVFYSIEKPGTTWGKAPPPHRP